MKILEYLNEKFSNSQEGLEKHFLEEFGVNINFHEGLTQFKYDQILAKWSKEITHECRGLILEAKDEWKIIARPFKKFFTFGQSQSIITADNIVLELPNLEWSQKCDGSCIMVYLYAGEWKASTLGSIPTGNVSDHPFSFRELFWKTIGLTSSNFGSYFNASIGRTYLFELCTPYNQVVTKYDSAKVFYLGTIINSSGEMIKEKNSLSLPKPFTRKVLANSVEEITKFVEESSKDESFGKNPEGWVLYKNGLPICKMKNTKYLALHQIGGGDIKCSRNRIIEAIFAGSYDDLRNDLPDMLKIFGDSVIDKIGCMTTYIDDLSHQLKGNYLTQKDYALNVQAKCSDKRFCSFLFQNKNVVTIGGSVRHLFIEWLKNNHEKFNKDFKND